MLLLLGLDLLQLGLLLGLELLLLGLLPLRLAGDLNAVLRCSSFRGAHTAAAITHGASKAIGAATAGSISPRLGSRSGLHRCGLSRSCARSRSSSRISAVTAACLSAGRLQQGLQHLRLPAARLPQRRRQQPHAAAAQLPGSGGSLMCSHRALLYLLLLLLLLRKDGSQGLQLLALRLVPLRPVCQLAVAPAVAHRVAARAEAQRDALPAGTTVCTARRRRRLGRLLIGLLLRLACPNLHSEFNLQSLRACSAAGQSSGTGRAGKWGCCQGCGAGKQAAS
jgi:hypothetical protein